MIRAAAKRKHDVATTIRQNIFSALLMTFGVFDVQLAKIVKISDKIRIFAPVNVGYPPL